MPDCANCHRPFAALVCGQCNLTPYCDNVCQSRHWKTHKDECIGRRIYSVNLGDQFKLFDFDDEDVIFNAYQQVQDPDEEGRGTDTQLWELSSNELFFVRKLNPNTIADAWGYSHQGLPHSDFEDKSHDFSEIQRYTDPIMQQFSIIDRDRYWMKRTHHAITNAFGSQIEIMEPKKQRKIVDLLVSFFSRFPSALRELTKLANQPLDDIFHSFAFMGFVISARQMLLLADSKFHDAYDVGSSFNFFMKEVYKKLDE